MNRRPRPTGRGRGWVFFTNSCEPELAHRLQTSKMRSEAAETVCQAFYHILRSVKTRFTRGRLFYTQGPFFCALGPLFCALVREEAIFSVCTRCANEGFACMCKVKEFFEVARGYRVYTYTAKYRKWFSRLIILGNELSVRIFKDTFIM